MQELRIKDALRICKTLDATYNKDELRIISIAYECYTGKSEFYKSLGINVAQTIKESIDLLQRIKEHSYVTNTKNKNK